MAMTISPNRIVVLGATPKALDRELARYIATMSGELSRMATSAGLDLVAYLLDMAGDEAECALAERAKVAEHVGPEKAAKPAKA